VPEFSSKAQRSAGSAQGIAFRARGLEQSHPQISWSDIIGQRNILAHEYGQIDYELLYKTVIEDIPQLVSVLQGLLPSE